MIRFALACCPFCTGASAQVITTFAGTEFSFPSQPLPAINAPLGIGRAQLAGQDFELGGGVTVDAQGDVYIADPINNLVARITPNGTLTIVVGNGLPGFSGDGGPATSAALDSPLAIAVDPAGNLYIADTGNGRIRKVSGGIITTVAGGGVSSSDGVPATSATISPVSIAVDSAGDIYFGDSQGQRVREVSGGIITTFAGGGLEECGPIGGPATNCSLGDPIGIAMDSAGNTYIADNFYGEIFKISGGSITIFAGGGINLGFTGDGGPATSAVLNGPSGIAVDSVGNVFISEYGEDGVGNGHRVRKVSGGVITTIAGDDSIGFSGDGGPATSAALDSPSGVAVDSAGNIYIADSLNHRIRKVSGGIITTLAGSGDILSTGDGGDATSAALNSPQGVAVDSADNVYIAEAGSNRIRRVSGGVITTVAGNGTASFSGDGGPAASAGLNNPTGIALDSAGNIYIADCFNQRIRKVSGGIITTVAGNGTGAGTVFGGFSGDGGPATSAELDRPQGVAVDSAGNILIADTGNQRVREVLGGVITTIAGGGNFQFFSQSEQSATSVLLRNPSGIALDSAGNIYIADGYRVYEVSNGIITIFAGNPDLSGYFGDGGPATGAGLESPTGVEADSNGNVYIADFVWIRKVSGGIITTIAGNGKEGFSGDGGPATNAALNNIFSVAVDSAAEVYIADSGNNRIREVLSQQPALQVSTTSLSLEASSGGKVATASLGVSTGIGGANSIAVPGMTYAVQVTAGTSWLSLMPQSGKTPGLITVTADPAGLAPGDYSASVTLSVPNANPQVIIVPVQLSVGAATPASLSVDHNHLSFTYSTTSADRIQTITVSNTGSGSLPFSVTATENSGQSANWLSVTPTSATVTPSTPAVISVEANPSNLPAGTYTGTVAIASMAGTATVSVTITISANPLIMLLSQTGLTFIAVQNGGLVPPQTFSVLSLGSGTLNWTAQTSVLGGVNNWLSVTPNSGLSAPGSSNTPPTVSVSVNPAGLAPGIYYGLVTVTAAGAANTPQGVVTVLQVLPAGTDIAPVVQPNALVFTGTVGNSSPSSQNVMVYDPTGTNKSFRSGIVTVNGGSWLVTLPGDATIPPNQPVSIVVQPVVNNLAAGTYQGTLTLQFSDGRVSSLPVQFIVAGAGSTLSSDLRGGKPADASQGCVAATLSPSLVTLGQGFSVPAGYPQGLEAQVVDNCGNPQVDGTVYVSFTNGDAPVKLQSLGNGVWDGTWPVGQTAQAVTLTVAAKSGAALTGQSNLNGGLSATMPAPQIFDGGVVNAASLTLGSPVAPGELISIFGQQLAGGQATAPSSGLPLTLAGATVSVGTQGAPGGEYQAMPLLFAIGGQNAQVNAMVPFETSVNTNQQILLQWGTAYAPPVYVDVAAAEPGIFQYGQEGIITDLSGNLIGPSDPAHAGDTVVIYCTGLGAVTPSVADGVPTPPAYFYTQSGVTITIGGQNVVPAFAGLTPGFAGLYQINVTVPQGVAPGDQVPVSIMVAGQTSAQVVTSVR